MNEYIIHADDASILVEQAPILPEAACDNRAERERIPSAVALKKYL